MSAKVHFRSGKVVELSSTEWIAFWNRLRNAGVRFFDSREQNLIIPFNNATIEYMEPDMETPRTVGEMEATKEETEKPNEPTEDKDRMEERNKMEKEFMDRANCRHKNDDGSTRRKLFYAETVNGRKYFPVCTFCGHRERYVGVQKIEDGNDPNWTTEDVTNAELYEG